MSRNYESTSETQTNTHVIDYSTIVEAVQLSAARLLGVDGSQNALSFAEVLAKQSDEDRERVICDVGSRFDDELINFMTAVVIARRTQQIIILAEASEGINGGLPWQPKLEQHMQNLRENGHLRNADVQVERYTSPDIAVLTQQAEALALESAPTI